MLIRLASILILVFCLVLNVFGAKNNRTSTRSGSSTNLNNLQSKFILFNKPECNEKRIYNIDLEQLKLSVFDKRGRNFPENNEQLKKFCSDSERYTKNAIEFSQDCLQDELQNMAKIFLFSVRRAIKSYCGRKNAKKTKELLKLAPCINRVVKTNQCLSNAANKTRTLVGYRIPDKIPRTCCIGVKLFSCFENSLDELDCSITDEQKQLIMDLIRGLLQDLMNFACGEYTDDSDKCDRMPSLSKKKFYSEDLVQFKPPLESMFFNCLLMFESIEEFSKDL